MKSLFFLFLLSIAVFIGCSRSAPREPAVFKVEGIDPETNLQTRYFAYKDMGGREVKHGSFSLSYPSGAKYVEANFVDGLIDGKCVIYSEEGRAEVVGIYRRGEPWDGEFQVGHEIRRYSRGQFVSTGGD